MQTLFRLLPGPQPLAVRLIVTILLVLAGFATRYVLGEATGRYGFIHFVLPVVAASLLFDRFSGFFAVALSIALVATLLPWEAGLAVHLYAIIVFSIVGCCLVFVAEGLHNALVEAHAAQEAANFLLQEMSHRVKNKFAMISSIIGIQARNSSPEVRRALEDVAARVNVMATVHNILQLSRHNGLMDMEEYLPSLGASLREALCGPRPITLSVKSIPIRLPADKALTVGLIVNELVTNAFKYAFPDDRSGAVQVSLSRAENALELTVVDGGRGVPEDRRTGLGTRLVTVLAAQLGGSAEWSNGPDGGCRARVQFPVGGG